MSLNLENLENAWDFKSGKENLEKDQKISNTWKMLGKSQIKFLISFTSTQKGKTFLKRNF